MHSQLSAATNFLFADPSPNLPYYDTPHEMRGLFIVLEGCDGTGKTTQGKRIAESGVLGACKTMAFPDRATPIGQLIDQYLKKQTDFPPEAISLLYTANRWELKTWMNATLDSGTSIVCDRYYFSGAAYSAANGLNLEWCVAPEEGIPVPDLVILIDVDPKILMSRKGFGDERYERLELQTKVSQTFHQFKSERPDLWVCVDGSKPLDEVTADIRGVVEKLVASKRQ